MQTPTRLSFLITALLAATLVADLAVRRMPIERIAFRAWEAAQYGATSLGAFRPNFHYANPRVYGDLANLGIELMKYPLMRQYAATPHMDFANGTFTAGLTNPNHLIQPGKQDFYDAATGIKTGYSAPAGYCVTASAKRGDLELIAVVMGARTPHGPMS